jgi:hypothetical protein
LYESVRVAVHELGEVEREGCGRKGRGGVVDVGDGMRRRRRSEGDAASLISSHTNEGVNPVDVERSCPVKEERDISQNFTRHVDGKLRTNIFAT